MGIIARRDVIRVALEPEFLRSASVSFQVTTETASDPVPCSASRTLVGGYARWRSEVLRFPARSRVSRTPQPRASK